MTATHEDGVAALLAEPHSTLVHRQLIDLWLEEGRDPRAEALALVRAHAASDGPRLLYAEVCERAGDEARAEFVRVQCELAALPRCDRAVYSPCECPYCVVRRKEERLHGDKSAAQWRRLPWGMSSRRSWRRGFITQLLCAAADWLAHGDAILAAHPVETVRLTTRPEAECLPGPAWQFAGRRRLHQPRAGNGPNELRPPTTREMLAAEWPGVTFRLPPVVGTHGTVSMGGVTFGG